MGRDYIIDGEEPDFITETDYIVADTHFNHDNIIKYCRNKDLSKDEEIDVEYMNELMINRWNQRVSENDHVIILGDFHLGRTPHKPNEIYNRLNGEKTYVMGDHDFYRGEADIPSDADEDNYWGIVECEDEAYLAMHFPDDNPSNVPGGDIDPQIKENLPENLINEWNGPIIAGHHHNNWLGNNQYNADYPLASSTNSKANVGVELTGYAPINMETLHKLLKTGQRIEKAGENGFQK